MGLWKNLFSTLFRDAPETDRVRFVRKYTEPAPCARIYHYEIYRAAKAKTAREFLSTKSVTEPLYYIVCETEEGTWGLDKAGLYLEYLLPWQTDTSRYDCDGRSASTAMSYSHFSLHEAARGQKDNFVMRITCGRCAVEWYDGVRYNNRTICKCPQCGSRNRVDSTNIKVYSIDAGTPPPHLPCEALLKQHLSRLKTEYAQRHGFATMQSRWDKLLLPEVFAWSVNAMHCELQKSMIDGDHHAQGRRFEGLYVAVSTVPTMVLLKVKASFHGGYSGFLNSLINTSGFTTEECDLAHWVYYTDGKEQMVHLTFLPSWNLIRTQGPHTITVLAQDLMTEAEKREAGIG